MTLYFAFPGGWGTFELNGLAEKELAATGAHGYGTEALALAHVNASPSPPQELLLQTLKADSLSPVGAGGIGDLSTPNATGGVSGAAKNLLGSGYQLVFGNTTGLLGRGLKVVIGVVLILSGIIHLSGADKAALGVAGKVVLPA
jgi:hypothetical protein